MAAGEGNVVLLQDNDIAPAQFVDIQHGEGTTFPKEGVPPIEVPSPAIEDIQQAMGNMRAMMELEMIELPQSRSKAMLILMGKGCCWRILAILIWSLIFILLTLFVITSFAGSYGWSSDLKQVIWFTPYLTVFYIMTVAIIIAGICQFNPIPVIFGTVWVFSFFAISLFLMLYADVGDVVWPLPAAWLLIFIIHYGYACKVKCHYMLF